MCCFNLEFAGSSGCKWVKNGLIGFWVLELVDIGLLQQNNSEKSEKGAFLFFNQQ